MFEARSDKFEPSSIEMPRSTTPVRSAVFSMRPSIIDHCSSGVSAARTAVPDIATRVIPIRAIRILFTVT
jgi:hypothetical protein